MDEKTTRIIRAKIYIAFAVIALVLLVVITGTTRRIALVAVAVYCLIMSYVNFRKAKEEDTDGEE